MSSHNDVVGRISEQLKKRGFHVQTMYNNLPPGLRSGETLYRPDIIVRDRKGRIVGLVEVETSEGGKAVAGAAILADICMERMNVKNKPKLSFVFYRSQSNLKLSEKRLLALKDRIGSLEMMLPITETDALSSGLFSQS